MGAASTAVTGQCGSAASHEEQAMTSIRFTRRAALLVAALALAGCAGMGGKPPAQQIHVMTSGGFTAAYNELTPQFERSTGTQVHTAYGASMGAASDSIPVKYLNGPTLARIA